MKTYLKTLSRMFKKHFTRFISIILIVLVAVGFISGIGSSADKLEYSLTDHYTNRNVSDLILKTESEDGFSIEQIAALKDIYGANNVETGMSLDAYINIDGENRLTRLYFLDNLEGGKVNVLEDIECAEITQTDCVLAYTEVSDNKIKHISTKTEIEIDFKDILTQTAEREGKELDKMTAMALDALDGVKQTTIIQRIVSSPLTFAKEGEPSYHNPEGTQIPDDINGINSLITLDNILYLPSSIIPTIPAYPPFFPDEKKILQTGDIYLSFENKGKFNAFGLGYDNYVKEQQKIINSVLGSDAENVRFIDLNHNASFIMLIGYSDSVREIGYVLMVAFLFVTALVVLSTMTRLMEEERGQIACLRTLGYSGFKIVFKYILFAMIATGIGGVGSYFVGLGLAYLICYVFNYSFAMPPISSQIALVFYLIVFSVIVVTTLGATFFAGFKMTLETPADLLRPKPPKAGKKSFLERIPLIWNRLSFKYKSTTRNVLRYLPRFIMTVVSVAVSTALVMAGLALLDTCIFGGIDSPSVMAIALVVIVFAALLTAVVIYTLTNINVSERNRELATLKVLGYHDKEVAGYIYREVYIDTAVGILFGYVLSTGIMQLLFNILGMGTIGGVSWYWWLVAPVFVFFATFLVTILLMPKIVKIDMNESLKAIE